MKIRRLDLGLLLVFRELIRHQRTTTVAVRLGLSQPAISHALGRLRDIFGDPLFVRRPNGMAPTPAALELAPRIDALLDLAGDTLGVRRSFDPVRSTRRFHLAGNDFMAAMLGPALQSALSIRAPGICFSMRFAVGEPALELLRSGAVELALGRFLRIPAGDQAVLLADEDFTVVARADHPALGDTLDLTRFLALDHVLVSFSGDLQGSIDHALASIGQSRNVVASVPMFLTALAMVGVSDAVTTIPTRLAHRYASRFGLRLFPVPLPVERFSTLAVCHGKRGADLGLDWLNDLVREIWQADDGLPRQL